MSIFELPQTTLSEIEVFIQQLASKRIEESQYEEGNTLINFLMELRRRMVEEVDINPTQQIVEEQPTPTEAFFSRHGYFTETELNAGTDFIYEIFSKHYLRTYGFTLPSSKLMEKFRELCVEKEPGYDAIYNHSVKRWISLFRKSIKVMLTEGILTKANYRAYTISVSLLSKYIGDPHVEPLTKELTQSKVEPELTDNNVISIEHPRATKRRQAETEVAFPASLFVSSKNYGEL